MVMHDLKNRLKCVARIGLSDLPCWTINKGELSSAGTVQKYFLRAVTGHKIELGIKGNEYLKRAV